MAPLQFASIMGTIISIISFIIIRTLCFGDLVSGWPSLICVIMLLRGIQLLSIGILGEYLAKTYLEVKNRPPLSE